MVMRAIFLLAASAAMASGAMAAGWKESVSGDLSNDRLAPTVVKLKTGNNVISGRFGVQGGVIDRDYFVVTIPAGKLLSAIGLSPNTQIGGSSSFIGVQRGKKMTVPPDISTPAKLLGWSHFTTSDEGRDILPDIGNGPGAIGFTPPLGPGSYTFWVQETSTCACKYEFSFQVSEGADQ